MSEAVKVIIRCRPLNERELRLQCETVVTMDTNIGQVQLRKPKTDPKVIPHKAFTFDGVYYTEETTQTIYDDICFPLVSGVLEGEREAHIINRNTDTLHYLNYNYSIRLQWYSVCIWADWLW